MNGHVVCLTDHRKVLVNAECHASDECDLVRDSVFDDTVEFVQETIA